MSQRTSRKNLVATIKQVDQINKRSNSCNSQTAATINNCHGEMVATIKHFNWTKIKAVIQVVTRNDIATMIQVATRNEITTKNLATDQTLILTQDSVARSNCHHADVKRSLIKLIAVSQCLRHSYSLYNNDRLNFVMGKHLSTRNFHFEVLNPPQRLGSPIKSRKKGNASI